MKWLRLIVGQQPILRLIAVLLMAIAGILFLLLQQVRSIGGDLPVYVETCGDYDKPCLIRNVD